MTQHEGFIFFFDFIISNGNLTMQPKRWAWSFLAWDRILQDSWCCDEIDSCVPKNDFLKKHEQAMKQL
jgi:hypothetical protein